jgi:hypothetical protein
MTEISLKTVGLILIFRSHSRLMVGLNCIVLKRFVVYQKMNSSNLEYFIKFEIRNTKTKKINVNSKHEVKLWFFRENNEDFTICTHNSYDNKKPTFVLKAYLGVRTQM